MPKIPRRSDPEKQKYWLDWMGRWQESDQTIVAFCAAHDLSVSSFRWWRMVLRRQEALPATSEKRHRVKPDAKSSPGHVARPKKSDARFLPVQVDSPSALEGPEPGAIDVMLRGGHFLRVRGGVSRLQLETVVGVLESKAC